MTKTNLANLKTNEKGIILRIEGPELLSHRLDSLGFWVGEIVNVLAKASLGGPMLVAIPRLGTRVMLRMDEAERILISI